MESTISSKLKLPVEAVFDLSDILKAVDGKLKAGKQGTVLLKV
ncbi:hypothetical protein [Flavobacterium sp. I-STPA6A]|nr:hypothetical protein [Flavobacterium sp. I-STPA6A]